MVAWWVSQLSLLGLEGDNQDYGTNTFTGGEGREEEEGEGRRREEEEEG